MSHYTRESDIVVGVTSSGRPPELPDVESMAGLFINTLPLRLRVRRELSMAALVAQAHEQNVRIRAVEFSPLASVQMWSGLPPGTPLFESIVVFENYPVDRLLTQTVAGLTIEGIEIDEATNYPLTVTIGPGTELLLQITFEAARFGPARVERLLRHYRAALVACATQPEQPVGELCLLDAAEWEQVLATWQGARVDVPLDACLHHWIERQAERTPADDGRPLRRRGSDVRRAERTRERARAPVDTRGCGARGAGRRGDGTLAGTGRGAARHSEGRRCVRAARSGVSTRPADVSDCGRGGTSRARATATRGSVRGPAARDRFEHAGV